MLSILTQFVSNRSQHVMVVSCLSELVNVVSRVPQGSLLGLFLFLLYTLELFSILGNKLIDYAGDCTLLSVVPSQGVRVTVGKSLIRDLIKVSEWFDLWGMKLNASKTKTMIDSRSCTMHPQSPPLTIGGTVLKKKYGDLVMELVFHLHFYFYIYFILKSFFCHVLGCGKDKGKFIFLRHLDGSMTGGNWSSFGSLSSELVVALGGLNP